MTIDRHDVLFQSIGGLVALAVAAGGVLFAIDLFGRYGVLSLFFVVPVAVVGGWAIIKLLHFARRILSD